MESAPFIALSLLLMLVVGILAVFLGGRSSRSSNWDDPDARNARGEREDED